MNIINKWLQKNGNPEIEKEVETELHEDYLNHLKQTNPILYYELTSDPTNASSGDEYLGCLGVIGCGVIMIILALIFVL